MSSRRSALIVAIVLGLAAGVGYPFADLALSCRAPTSEACVWAKAYLPFTVGLSVVMIGVPITALVYAGVRWWRSDKSPPR